MKVNKTIELIEDQCDYNTDQIIQYVFDKLETERSLFWIQVARTVTNRLSTEKALINQ